MTTTATSRPSPCLITDTSTTRPTRQCRHPRAGHRHGSRTAYVRDRCRCTSCTAANASHARTVRRERLLGRWAPFQPAAPIHEHLQSLRAAGLSSGQVAMLAGVAPATVRALHGAAGQLRRDSVRADTARRLLAVTPSGAVPAERATVDGRGTRRRLHALAARGWTRAELARRLGRSPSSLARSMSSPAVTARTDRDVRALYDRLWDVPVPETTGGEAARAARARAHAAAREWTPPLGWDDIDRDVRPPSPCGQLIATGPSVDHVAVERAVRTGDMRLSQLTLAEQVLTIRQLSDQGLSLRQIATRLHTSTRTVSRRRDGRGPPERRACTPHRDPILTLGGPGLSRQRSWRRGARSTRRAS